MAAPQSCTLWVENNLIDKVNPHIFVNFSEERTKELISYNIQTDEIKTNPISLIKVMIGSNSYWNNKMLDNTTSIYEYEVWQLRTLISKHWFEDFLKGFDYWNPSDINFKNISFKYVSDLKSNFINTILEIVDYFDILPLESQLKKLSEIEVKWKEKQIHIKKDELCNSIVDSIKNNYFLDWSTEQLSILDESWIQKQLDKSLKINWKNLNKFPTNSNNFQFLLERN